jgi:ERF superfamily protein
MSTDVIHAEPQTPFDLVRMALEKDVDVDKLERLLAMQKDWQADVALRAYADAMNLCQQEMPVVIRDKTNESTNSRFARLETVALAIRPVYTKHGFCLDFTEAASPLLDHRRIVCNVTHTGGHQKQFYLDSKIDDVGVKGNANKTAVQGLGSMTSYLRRYLTLMVFNIVIADEDNDGQASKPLMSDLECEILRTKFEDCVRLGIYKNREEVEGKILEWLSKAQKSPETVDALESIQAQWFPVAVKELDKKIRMAQPKETT